MNEKLVQSALQDFVAFCEIHEDVIKKDGPIKLAASKEMREFFKKESTHGKVLCEIDEI